jgi:hypothetical protein
MKALFALTAALFGAAAFSVPALADGQAFGNVRPDDRAGIRGSSNPAADPVASVRPDDRAGLRGSGAVASSSEAPLVLRVQAPGFDWGDAGIGAAAGVGFVLLLVGGSRVVRVARTQPRPA